MADDTKDQNEEATPEQEADAAATDQKRESNEPKPGGSLTQRVTSKVTGRKSPEEVAADRSGRTDSAGNVAAPKSLLSAFLKLSGYDEADIIGSNESRRTFVTTNGGKYVVNKKGTVIRILQGPAYPKMVEAAEEEDDE